MASNDTVFLRSLELRLLRCSIPSDSLARPPVPTQSSPPVAPQFPHLLSLLNDVVALIESGDYVQALTSSSASQALFSCLQLDSFESAHRFYSETLPDCVSSFLNVSGSEDSVELGCKALLVMAVAVASLLAFTQCNITGPLDNLSLMPLAELSILKYLKGGGEWMEWEAWAQKELMSVGSDLCAKFSNLQYLIFGKTLLLRMKDALFEGSLSSIDGVRSTSWWLARALFLHQKLLDERASSLFDLLQVFTNESFSYLGTLEKIKEYWCPNEDCSTILSMLQLEAGILELYYGRLDTSKRHFESAAEVCNFNFSLTGALGFRTMHQVEPKAQLRLVTGTNGGDNCLSVSTESSNTNNSPLSQSSETYEDSDILVTPRFVVDERNIGSVEQDAKQHSVAATPLSAIQQALILAQCLLIEKSTRNDELQNWEMAPYIEAIDSQNLSPFMLRCFCNLLRIRWESSRNRTKQRSLMTMEKLVEGVYDHSPGVAERLYYCFGVNTPPIPTLRKEYGDLLVSCGLIGEALKIYEDLELWDNLIYCYQLMDKKAAAVELIKKRLCEKPSDPRLWCSLGDVTNDDASYEKALEVSGRRSARAFRSLARSAYNRGEFEKSKMLWESAMGLNSLYPDGWFALGAAALKSRDVDKALDAFTRAVQLDPENGEAWNNVACLHMVKKRSKEAFIAFKEALKLKRDSWQMWENFSHVAVDVGNLSQAMEAVQKVLEKSKMKRIDSELLERIMLEIEGRASTTRTDSGNVNSNVANASETYGLEVESARNRETEHLIELIGQILRQIVRSGGNAEIWGLYARWHKLKGDLAMCSEALLKQVRSYQGSDLWKDKDRFVKFANASLELCKVYQELALHGNSRKELFAAEMHLKSTIKQAMDFSDTKEYRDLVACLEDVQGALKATTLPGA
ncbi:Protein prenylyltransferase superfamily protein [Perilla frutescens var. hirtella]|uniref:Protein prenylyltransferase superfamily protein n=1 Tax=Perilla frutescens var. hirtella TaxID=608512 RepID=A0AAD4PDG0_PERFH|nr:Protein prenylyltransferase superfamily protein [Perilla frutescens var. hirtella]